MKKQLLTFLLAVTATTLLAAQSGEEIMRMVDEKKSPHTIHAALQMDLVDTSGNSRSRQLEIWGTEDKDKLSKQVMVFWTPASVKGTRFLTVENKTRDDDKWIYLPALKKVRRIAASEGGSAFMGSEFSYDDMETRKVEDYTYKLLKEETVDGYACWVVESVPKTPADSQYSRAVNWVIKDPSILTIIKIELFDKDGEPLKVATMGPLKKIDSYWTPMATQMRNLQTGRTTVLKMLKIEYDKPVNPRLFTTRFLETGRVQ